MRQNITLDAEKLTEIIRKFARETDGPCTNTGACIGVIDGKQIRLCVEADEDEFSTVTDKYKCVTVGKE